MTNVDKKIASSDTTRVSFGQGSDSTTRDRKSTRLNSSHRCISYAVSCLKKKNIMRKLQLHSVSDLVLYAVRNNIIHVAQAGTQYASLFRLWPCGMPACFHLSSRRDKSQP